MVGGGGGGAHHAGGSVLKCIGDWRVAAAAYVFWHRKLNVVVNSGGRLA